MSASDSSGNARPKQQLNGDAKEWTPKSSLTPASAVAPNPIGNGFEYNQESAYSGSSGAGNPNHRIRYDGSYQPNSGHHRGPASNRDSQNRYINSANMGGGYVSNIPQVPQVSLGMNMGINPYANPNFILAQQYMQYGYPMGYHPQMMAQVPMYYPQPSTDIYGPMMGQMHQNGAVSYVPLPVPPVVLPTAPVVLTEIGVLPVIATPTPVGGLDQAATIKPQSEVTTETEDGATVAATSKITEAGQTAQIKEEVVIGELKGVTSELGGEVPVADVPVENEANIVDCSNELVYSKEILLSLFSKQPLPEDLLQFYPGLEKGKEPLNSNFNISSLSLRSSPKVGNGGGSGKDFHRSDSREFSGHGPSGRRDRDSNANSNRSERDRDYRDRDRERGFGSGLRVSTGPHGDGEMDEAASPQVFYSGANSFSRRSASNTPHPMDRERDDPSAAPAVYVGFGAKEAESEADVIMRKATSVLNKLSLTKFEKLSDEFITIIGAEGCNAELLNRVVELLVTKAQMEEHFCFMYADLCRKICKTWDTVPIDPAILASSSSNNAEVGAEEGAGAADKDKDKDGEADGDDKQVTMGKFFRNILLLRCQQEFEIDRVKQMEEIRTKEGVTEEQRLELELLLKKRYTGHMRFIGEIYIKDLVQGSTINDYCLQVLIKETEEEKLVCLCKLFQTVGDKIEKYFAKKAKAKKNKGKGLEDVIPGYFRTIEELAQSHPSSRIKFMLLDLIDMRNNNWTARREAEKVVDLNESRGIKQAAPTAPVGGASSSAVAVAAAPSSGRASDAIATPAAVAPPVDEWTEVGARSKKDKEKSKLSGAAVPAASQPSSAVGKSSSRGDSQGNSKKASSTGPLNKKSSISSASSSSSSSSSGRSGHVSGSFKRSTGDEQQPPSSSSGKGDAVPSAVDSSPPGIDEPQEPLSSSAIKKMRSALDDYYYSGSLEDAILSLKEVASLKHGVDLFKNLLLHSLEEKADRRTQLSTLLSAISSGNLPLLRRSDISEGLERFLEDLDDLIIDIPHASSRGASLTGDLVSSGLLLPAFFSSLQPERNANFLSSSRAAEFFLQTIKQVKEINGDERAAQSFLDAGIDILSWVRPPPRQDPGEYLYQLVEKYSLLSVIPLSSPTTAT